MWYKIVLGIILSYFCHRKVREWLVGILNFIYTEKNEHFRIVFVMEIVLVILSKLLISTSIVDSSLSHTEQFIMRGLICKKYLINCTWSLDGPTSMKLDASSTCGETHRSLETRSAAHRRCASYLITIFFFKFPIILHNQIYLKISILNIFFFYIEGRRSEMLQNKTMMNQIWLVIDVFVTVLILRVVWIIIHFATSVSNTIIS